MHLLKYESGDSTEGAAILLLLFLVNCNMALLGVISPFIFGPYKREVQYFKKETISLFTIVIKESGH